MTEGRKKGLLPAPRAILIAAVAGLLAGAVAVYVRGELSGNGGAAQDEVVAAAPAPDDTCPAKAEQAKALAATAVGDVAAMTPADPPVSLAGLSLNGPDGKPTTLGGIGKRVLLVNLWATWCAPCREEMPALDALQAQRGGPGFEVVAVNVDTGDDVKPKKFLAETGIKSLAYYRENTLALFNDLKKRGLALGLPVTLLIDAEGCLLANMNGPAHWASPDALRFIDGATGRN